MKQIAKLYALEDKWKNCTPEERLLKRQQWARPELEKLFTMIVDLRARLFPRHGLQDVLTDAAKRAAVFYSLLATCKLNKVNPAAWLTHVLKTMSSLPRERYSESLPHRWNSPSA